jgi:paired amphipathic helix protein Sin3a
MKSYRSQHVFDGIDTPCVIQRVASLFHGHPSLIQGFNAFLPVGYRIEVGSDPQSSEVVAITSSSETMLQSNIRPNTSVPPPQPATPPHEPGRPSAGSIDVSYHERQGLGFAMDYVQRVKTRFSNDPDIYKQFLEILVSHKSNADNVGLGCHAVPDSDVSFAG